MSLHQFVTAKIFRYDPTTENAPRYETFEVPFENEMRVLDVLDYVAENCGVGVGYRWFCGVKRCGMCGVTVNGKPVLACWEKAAPSMLIEPLPNMPVIRDLVVDRSAFERSTLDMEPCLERSKPYGTFPEPLTHTDFEDAFKLMNCIECYVCTAACPVFADADHRGFAGPASFVQLAKVALHPRDEGDRVALALKGDIYACVSCYQCSNVCPVGINVLGDAIEKLKRQCAAHPAAGPAHASIFSDLVRQFGRIHPPTLMRRTRGLLASMRKIFLALAMARKGKIQIAPRSAPGMDEIRKLFDVVEKNK
jgi:succinate dehydrogenase/fumarate reductase iron-sulfur protein